MSSRGFLGAGDLYIERIVNGVPQGLTGPYECRKLSVKPNVELKEMTSKGRYTYGQVIESVPIPKPAEFEVELGEVTTEAMTLALLGTAASVTQTAGTLTNAPIVAKLDKWVAVGKENLTAAPTVKNQAGTTTYVEGTDYEVNRSLGMIKAKTGGTITDAQQLTVSGAYGAISGTNIAGATNGQLRARFVLDGINYVDNTACKVEFYEAIIAVSSAFDFLANDFNSVSLPGKMKTPAGKTAPFVVTLKDGA